MRVANLMVMLLLPLTSLATAYGEVPRLTADDLLLVVNRNVPAGLDLARHYAATRGVPDRRIVILDLPDAEEISRRQYDTAVFTLRRFIRENELTGDVRCVVTFFGVPLRVGPRVPTPAEQRELADLRQELEPVRAEVGRLVALAETAVADAGSPSPLAGSTAPVLQRLQAAEAAANTRPADADLQRRLREVANELSAPWARRHPSPESTEVDPPEVLNELAGRVFDAPARLRLRASLREAGDLVTYSNVLEGHARFLDADQSDASFDSELALLSFPPYALSGWMPNPMQGLPLQAQDAAPPDRRPLMVSRLDGRDPQQVRDVIAASVLSERDGLEGPVVIDSRGIRLDRERPDGYAVFDEQLRELAAFLDPLPPQVVHDDGPELIPPGSAEDIALYVGWYSLQRYQPPGTFARGAVGYHVASFEMTSLRNPGGQWVGNLMREGVVATTGPVSEPYLHAFPPPAVFFPLLMTGELTLAEVYWASVPMTSWKMGLIGDPLYRPYGVRPALRPEDLPAQLRPLLPGR